MGLLLVAVILVIGFTYTNNDPESRFTQKRSTGWDSYFHVASWGLLYCIYGLILAHFLFLILSAPVWFISKVFALGFKTNSYWLYRDFVDLDIYQIPFSAIVSVGMGAFLAYGVGKKNKEHIAGDHDKRLEIHGKLIASDGLEKLLFDAMREKLLVQITMQSRKVYVGMIHEMNFEHDDTENIVIIPMLSGHRDEQKLRFKEDHNYIGHYRKNHINGKSTPLNILHFRIVLPRNRVESASLFDAATYIKFQNAQGDGSKTLADDAEPSESVLA